MGDHYVLVNHYEISIMSQMTTDVPFVVVTTPSSYMIYHRIYNTGATSGADITFVVVTTPSSYMMCHSFVIRVPLVE
jgi:hypothetical protein